jgi:Cu2+-exporting ATPase
VLMSLSTVIVAINAQFLRRADLSLPNLSRTGRSTQRAEPTPAD